jgi:UDP-N-acetyl-D-mannosaminuronate dehydrogenase
LKITVTGMAYVGLPLAVEFGKMWPTIGFDAGYIARKSWAEGSAFRRRSGRPGRSL